MIFVFEPADGAPTSNGGRRAAATQLASHLMRICSEHTGEGTIWPVDAALRPEGKAGPLVRTLASHRGYYERWAKTWEFQALLKARPVAGDLALGREYVDMRLADGLDGGRAGGVRRRHPGDAPPGGRAHPGRARPSGSSSSGSGGLRDVEFAVQLLQLVHGRADEQIRPPTTLSALAAADPRRVRRPRGRRGAARGLLRSCARSSTGSSSSSCAAPTWCPRTRRRCAGSAAAWATQGPGRTRSTRCGSTTAARCAGCTRSSSTGRCSTAVAQIPGDGGAARRPRPPSERLAALGYARPEGGAAPPRGADQRGHPHRQHPAHAAAGDARVVRRRARPRRRAVRLPPDQRVARRHARGTSRRCATRARSPSGWRGCSPPPATPPTCSSASRRASGCWGRTWCRCPREALTEEMLAAGRPPGRPRGGGPRGPRRSGAASCSGSRPATCSA